MKLNHQAVEQAVTASCQRAERSRDEVQVVAVTKYVDLATMEALLKEGIHHFGENRADKFLEKVEAFKGQDVVWHYIGSLQRRKVKDVINQIDYFHALDSLSLAKEIQKRAEQPIKCFLQVNISGEESKHGFTVEAVKSVLPALADLDKIEIVGLMTMAPFEADRDDLIAIFRQCRQLRDELQAKKLKTMPMTALSMGMSGDFDVAIQEGATFVRIGSLFYDEVGNGI